MKVTNAYNNYNIFFILERTLLIHSRNAGAAAAENRPSPSKGQAAGVTGYEDIDLPPLPPRYQPLQSLLAENWYDPGRKKLTKRKHTKSHGVATFKEIANTVASNWKQVDRSTRQYVDAVALLLKRRYKELMKEFGGILPDVTGSVSGHVKATPSSKEEEKRPGSPSPSKPEVISLLDEEADASLSPGTKRRSSGATSRVFLELKRASVLASDPIVPDMSLSELLGQSVANFHVNYRTNHLAPAVRHAGNRDQLRKRTQASVPKEIKFQPNVAHSSSGASSPIEQSLVSDFIVPDRSTSDMLASLSDSIFSFQPRHSMPSLCETCDHDASDDLGLSDLEILRMYHAKD